MYESNFQFHERPFVAAPQAVHYFPAASIELARQNLVRCIERAEGPGLIIGPAGTGKTLLCLNLADYFRQRRFQVAMLASARLGTRRALLQNILFELNLPYRGMEEGELRLSLIDHLEPRGSGAAGLLLVVDEAHTLPLRLIEEIRLISNFIRDGQPRVRLILAGGPELEERLASPKLQSFQQRIAARCYLQSLQRDETAQYVRHQVRQVGGNPDTLFTPDALRSIHTATDGIPRLINQVCDHALVLAALNGQTQIDVPGIEEAWADLQQLPVPWQSTPRTAVAPAESSSVEFGQLDEVPVEASPAVLSLAKLDETATATRAAANLECIDRSLSALGNGEEWKVGALEGELSDAAEFRPTAGSGTEVEIVFTTPANPFGEGFDEEEIVIDPLATLAAERGATPRFEPDNLPFTPPSSSPRYEEIEEETENEVDGGALTISLGEDEFIPASDPVLPESRHSAPPVRKAIRNDRELSGREDAARGRNPLPINRPKQREYRTLFSTLRGR